MEAITRPAGRLDRDWRDAPTPKTARLMARLLAVVGTGFLLHSPLIAQSPGVLSGLTAVNVLVRLEGAARAFPGLNAAELEREVRRRLLHAGMQVADVVAGPDRGQAPVFELVLIMYADSARPRRYAFSLTGMLTEGVTLRRRDGERRWAGTWTGGSAVGIVGEGGAEILRADIAEMVKRFLSDWKAANHQADPGSGAARPIGLPARPFSQAVCAAYLETSVVRDSSNALGMKRVGFSFGFAPA